MKVGSVLLQQPASSFLSCEKDTEIILRKLFIEARPYSDILKRLLVVQNKDALDTNYDVDSYNLKRLIDEQYIVLTPKVKLQEHAQVKSFITLNFDNFIPTSNPEFRDCVVYIDIACHDDYWDLGNYRQRPYKIMGYIDGILNKSRLTGIGQLTFVGGNQSTISIPNWTCWTLQYLATHGSDDRIANEE